MRAGTIEVVLHDGELFFKSCGVLLDKLEASDFYMANLSINRGGSLIDTGLVFLIRDTPIFDGFHKVLKEFSHKFLNDVIYPDYFEEGDEIRFVLSHPFDWEINFRELYAEDEVAARLADIVERISDFDLDSEEAEVEADNYSMIFQHELSHFKFPPNPIWRRIE